jgi:hypothetical protein
VFGWGYELDPLMWRKTSHIVCNFAKSYEKLLRHLILNMIEWPCSLLHMDLYSDSKV